MHLTDREKQAISCRNALKGQEKRKKSKNGILSSGLHFYPKSKHTKRTQMHIGATAHTVRKGKRRLASTTSLGWSIRTAWDTLFLPHI